MPRYFLKLQYDGSKFHGWQSQINAIAVQDRIEDALKVLLGKETSVQGCGRTDTGVHAKEYYAHFDFSDSFDQDALMNSLNSILDHEIAINKIIPVGNDCHTRFDATSRTYIYQICNKKNPFFNNYSWFKKRMPQLETLQSYSNILLEFENFKAFAKKGGNPGNYLCKLSKVEWTLDDGIWKFEITANRFLRNMVRSIIGTVMEAAIDNWTPEYFREVVQRMDRSETGASVPAKGLFLVNVVYPYLVNDEYTETILKTETEDGK